MTPDIENAVVLRDKVFACQHVVRFRDMALPSKIICELGDTCACVAEAIALSAPTREQIAKAIYDAKPYETFAWDQAPRYVREVTYERADAVVALYPAPASRTAPLDMAEADRALGFGAPASTPQPERMTEREAKLVEACIKLYVDCTTTPQTTYHYCAICGTGRDDVLISEPIEHATDCPLATTTEG